MKSLTIPYRSGRIAVLADLHWDSYARIGTNPIEAHDLHHPIGSDVDALIIAGDLANGPPQPWQAALSAMKRRLAIEHVYVLPANYDYYLHGLDGDGALEHHARAAGATVVQKCELRHGATRILCCTLWTDFELYAPLRHSQAAQRLKLPPIVA